MDSPWEMTIRLDTMLHAVQLPAGITHLDSGLADMDRDAFPHDDLMKILMETRRWDRLSRSVRGTDKLLRILRVLGLIYSGFVYNYLFV